ncbi:MAG: UBA/TS-N domain protein [Lachnospiraceae bacterium]
MELSNEEKFDKAMKLSARTGASLEDAKAALNACDFDMLDAVVYLEKLGKVTAPESESYTTSQESSRKQRDYEEENTSRTKKVTFGNLVGSFFKWLGKIIKIGNENFFDVEHNGTDTVKLPLTLCVVLLVFAFWVCIPLLIVGLFFSFRYSFSGPLFKKDDVFNSTMNKAADVTENIKREFNEAAADKKSENDEEESR